MYLKNYTLNTGYATWDWNFKFLCRFIKLLVTTKIMEKKFQNLGKYFRIILHIRVVRLAFFFFLTLCGTRNLQFFYAEILPEFKNGSMPKTVNAICKQIIKVKKSYKISGMYFSGWEFSVCVFAPDTLCHKGLTD